MLLEGRKILVTGAGVRVGRILALALAKAGADVAVHYRHSESDAVAVVQEVEKQGGHAVTVCGDLALPEVRARLVGDAASALDGLDGLINNASLFDQDLLEHSTRDEWDRMIDVNARAPMLLGRALADQLPDGIEGDVVHINDIHCLKPRGDYFAYTQSKALLHAMTGNMALALAPRVRVNAVALGAVLPPELPPQNYEHTGKSELPLGRYPALEDVASAVVFLLGCRSITGETIRVDGGQHLS